MGSGGIVGTGLRLMPCPFCGSDGNTLKDKNGNYGVYCTSDECGCRFGCEFWNGKPAFRFGSKEEAVNAWNTRKICSS